LYKSYFWAKASVVKAMAFVKAKAGSKAQPNGA
jgi:hypothetical protein